MPSTTSSVVVMPGPNWTSTMPSAPTRPSASATSRPSAGSVAAMVATASSWAWPESGLAERRSASAITPAARSMPATRSTGLVSESSTFSPSWISALARTVAVVVPSPATSLVCLETSRTTWAPMFSNRHGNSTSSAMLTPSRETIGVPIGRSMIAFMPLGPSVPCTASVSLATPRPRAARASARWSIIFGMSRVLLSPCFLSPPCRR